MLKLLLESGMACDVCIIVGDEKFKAHKSILAARSPVLRTRFSGQNGDPNASIVGISDIEPSIFKAVLHFIHSDSCLDLHEISGSTSTNVIEHLLKAASRYGLNRLKQLCEARLFEDINAETVAATLSPAEQHQYSEQLEAICLKFPAAGLLLESGNLQEDQQLF